MDSLSNKEHERLLLMSEHGIAPPLSPAASAVWRAFTEDYFYSEDIDEYNVSAAIRAAADQLDHAASAHTLYAIATELDGTND
jgi:DnaJ-domain-containing protein 1